MPSRPSQPAEPPSEPVTGLVGRLDGEIDFLLGHFRLGRREAKEALRDVVLLMSYRWERLESRELWILAALKRQCLRCSPRRAATPDL